MNEPERLPALSEAERDRLTRESIFDAARGRGEFRAGAYPIQLDRPGPQPGGSWNPAAYTLAMIRNDYPSFDDVMSDADVGSIHAILEARVQECRDERDGHGRKKKREWAKP
jgi:hypothetical protein